MLPTSFRVYKKTSEAWVAMLQACKEAKETIDLEQYIFLNDEIGKQFIEVFKEKTLQGVKIRLLVDMAGSFKFYSSVIPEELMNEGIEVRFFNPIRPWRIHTFTSWFFRNHKKTLVIDGKVAFTGGTGVGYYMANWRDTTARMEGNVAREIKESFEELWWHVKDRRMVTRIKNFRKNRQKQEFITNSPYLGKRFLYYVMIESFRRAKKSIHITTPYFIPDRRLRRVLRLAAHRGVDVKVIVPKVLDVPIVELASHSLYTDLLKNGVRIFKYQPHILHAKTAIVDGEWATFGSFNLDSLSFVYNFEANVVTFNREFIQEIERNFEEDLSMSEEITHEQWQKRSFNTRVGEFLGACLRRIL